MLYVYAIGRTVYRENGEIVASFHNAFAAQEYAAAVNAGDVDIEPRRIAA